MATPNTGGTGSGTGRLLPLAFSELLNLTTQNIDSKDITFKNVSLQSGRYVTVKEENKSSVAVVDVQNKTVLRLPVSVDSAIMHPTSKVIALRASSKNTQPIVHNLQIYNLEMKTKMKTTVLEQSVVFWKWIDTKTIAIVTDQSVYHWSMDGDAQPVKMFDRSPYETAVQILNYRTSADQKWLLLGGIAAGSGGAVVGMLQVYSVDLKASQPTMDAHAACFANVQLDGRDKPSQLFCFTAKNPSTGPRLNIIEVGVPKDQAFNCQKELQLADLLDFPVALLPDNAHGMLFVLTKQGILSMYEIQSGKNVFSNRASQTTMFASVESDAKENGIVTVDGSGRVAHFYVDEKNIVTYITQELKDLELGVNMARRYNLPGADHIFKAQFQRLIQAGQMDQAIELAAQSPQGVLRNQETIQLLKGIDGGKALLQYFQQLLQRGKLNAIESIELSKLVLAKGAIEHIKTWLKEQKLEVSEELGDLLRQHNAITVALSVYLRANIPEKVIGCFLALGAQETEYKSAIEYFSKLMEYASRVNFTPDYPILVQQLGRVNSDRAKDFALLLLHYPDGPKIDIRQVVETFRTIGDIKNFTNILLEYLKQRGDREEDADLQTQLFETSLMSNPAVADAIFASEDFNFTHYDRPKIGQLCERAGLFQRALEHYVDLQDIKRVLANAGTQINPEFLLEFFGRMTPANCLDCLRDLLRYNPQQNFRLVVEVAKKWNDYLTSDALIGLFEEFDSYQGLFYYLGAFVNFTENSQIVFKYIEAAVKLEQLKEVERVARDNNHYDAEKVKEFLIHQNLRDPRALIYVCDRHGYVDELTHYLYQKNMYPFIEAYVQRMNAKAAPEVLGSLIDLNAPDDQIQKLINATRPPTDDPTFYERLVDQVESRNRLKILRQFLEARANDGSTDTHVHNGLAKIYVDINYHAADFLTTNKFYDSATVGLYCETRDPHLSVIAYKRANGSCDDQLLVVCNKNGFFKDLARYLVERQDLDLWAKVLTEDNTHRRQLIDQVVATALPESRSPDEVSTTVKAFMSANLPNELMELLERIILHGPADGEFQSNRNLQNLLILTAIKADKKRVMDYVKRLNNYDGPDIAKIAISDQYKLYEEAFFIYKKFKKNAEAIQVLLDNIDSMERAVEFAEYIDLSDVWSILGRAQLDRGMVKEAIGCFLKSEDASHFVDVISSAKSDGLFEELIDFLRMARQKIKDVHIDNELIFAYAKTNRLADLEDFLSQSTIAKVGDVGDLCFHEGLFEAARILYTHIGNNAKLAVTLVRLKLFHEAVDAARKANNIITWKEVCFACVQAKEFRLAQICAMHVIGFMDHMMDLVHVYERLGHFEELINVLEQGINLDRAHQGMFTQLGVCYARYKEEKLMEHVKLFWSRLNIPTLLVACQQNLHWSEAVFLYTHYDQFDNAIDTLIEHSTECWNHSIFKETINQVSTTDVYYRAVNFYITEHPLMLNDLLLELAGKLDHSRAVEMLSLNGHLALTDKYMQQIQSENLIVVNEALNSLYLQQENYLALRTSVDSYNNFDQIALAQQLEHHDLLEFRRIASYLYRKNKRYDRSLELSKKDELWHDTIDTAADSRDSVLVESLLQFFVDKKLYECWSATQYTCFELVRPDVVLEQAWRNRLTDYSMPFVIQTLRDYDDKLNGVVARIEAKEREQHEKEEQEKKKLEDKTQVDAALGVGPMAIYPQASPMLALPAPQSMLALPPGSNAGYYPPTMNGSYGY